MYTKSNQVMMIARRFFSFLSHVDQAGKASMVNVAYKAGTKRIAQASGQVFLGRTTFLAVKENTVKKFFQKAREVISP